MSRQAQAEQFPACVQVPQTQGGIPAHGGQLMAIRAENSTVDRLLVADQAVTQLGVAGGVDLRECIPSHAGHRILIGAEGSPQELGRGWGEGAYLRRRMGSEVPQTCCFVVISGTQ